MSSISARLAALADPAYQAFQAKLIPTLPSGAILGVRMPALRAFARGLNDTPEAEAFLAALPHALYEENCLHSLLLNRVREGDACLPLLEAFLPYVDNWATCDLLNPLALAKRPPGLPARVRAWLDSEREYTVRFGLGVLMRHYLGEAFEPRYLDWAADLRADAYYVRMMAAWYYATALACRYADALPYVANDRLEPWTRRKAIQKALESERIPAERKAELRRLRAALPQIKGGYNP